MMSIPKKIITVTTTAITIAIKKVRLSPPVDASSFPTLVSAASIMVMLFYVIS